jgi:hypothetical protein
VIPSDLSFGCLSAELKSPVKIPIPEIGGMAFFYLGGASYLLPKNEQWSLLVWIRHPIIHLLPYLMGWLVSVHYLEIRGWLNQNGLKIIVIACFVDVVILSKLQSISEFGFKREALMQTGNTY